MKPLAGLARACAHLLLLVVASAPLLAEAASCSISPQNPTLGTGQRVTWSYTVSGISGTPARQWSFAGGTPATSTAAKPKVTYATAGRFATSLTLTRNGATASCTTTVSVTAPDKQAPSVPANLLASARGQTQIALTWTPSTDNTAVTGYRVERCTGASCTRFKQIATPTTASYNDSGLSANTTYRYRVRAGDAAGNLSGYSAVAAATTAATAVELSINSTSQSSAAAVSGAVPQQAQVANTSYSIIAINDLGMHCGDLDTRIASILPPFQVLLAQVVQKAGRPVLNPSGVTLSYSATANPTDPALADTSFPGRRPDGSTYKTNFWDYPIRDGTYDAFYPGVDPFTQVALPSLADIVTPDSGLLVPNVEDLYLGPNGVFNDGDELLSVVSHAMPGESSPYQANAPRPVQEYYVDKPFFMNFPFGYLADQVNWFEAAGIPVAAFDDQGRENPYPLFRIQATAGGQVVSTLDTVLPISGEASCVNCHADPSDTSTSRSTAPTDALLAAGLPVMQRADDPDPTLPQAVSLEYATDLNVLRLHDLKHGAKYVDTASQPAPCTIGVATPDGSPTCLTNLALVQHKPVICQVCHYSPALDLAQVGPQAGPPGSAANGRNQVAHQSNSRVMHHHHGSLGGGLFPAIPPPVQGANGAITNQTARLAALQDSCYQCHPGKKAQCLRGAMFNGGMLCSDCHGSMTQIGDDFSKDVSTSHPGAFLLASDFYTNPATPRVPWGNEPGCGSCHTGDATSNLTAIARVLVNVKDTSGNQDGIRLRQAFLTGDAKATPIVPTNKRFAEPVIPAVVDGFSNPGAGNPRLYRVSSGHGGVMCEGCHGPTHAEWPNANPNANDNVAAKQLQGHTGTLNECGVCHVTSQLAAGTQGGPHGMHLVNDSRFWGEAHGDVAEAENRKPGGGSCGACHGADHLGTVLSRTPVARSWTVEGKARTVAAGQPVACNLCHSLGDSFGD